MTVLDFQHLSSR